MHLLETEKNNSNTYTKPKEMKNIMAIEEHKTHFLAKFGKHHFSKFVQNNFENFVFSPKNRCLVLESLQMYYIIHQNFYY